MLSDVTIGQYYPVESFMHKLDPRVKILLLITYIVFIFVVKSLYGFIFVGIYLIVSIILSNVPILKILSSLKGILFIVLITVILNLFFFDKSGNVALDLKFTVITWEAINFCIFMVLRLVLLILGTSLLSLTTTPVSLTDGLESLMKPLKIIHFPVHEIALVMSIALRFIPILMNETDRIIMAQKARGAQFESGNLFKKLKAFMPVLIPLLTSSIRKAEELGDAMEARCYTGSKNRTKYKKLKLGYRDLIYTIITATMGACVIIINTNPTLWGLIV